MKMREMGRWDTSTSTRDKNCYRFQSKIGSKCKARLMRWDMRDLQSFACRTSLVNKLFFPLACSVNTSVLTSMCLFANRDRGFATETNVIGVIVSRRRAQRSKVIWRRREAASQHATIAFYRLNMTSTGMSQNRRALFLWKQQSRLMLKGYSLQIHNHVCMSISLLLCTVLNLAEAESNRWGGLRLEPDWDSDAPDDAHVSGYARSPDRPHEMSQPTSISKPITGKRDTPGKEEREEEEGKTDRLKKWLTRVEKETRIWKLFFLLC